MPWERGGRSDPPRRSPPAGRESRQSWPFQPGECPGGRGQAIPAARSGLRPAAPMSKAGLAVSRSRPASGAAGRVRNALPPKPLAASGMPAVNAAGRGRNIRRQLPDDVAGCPGPLVVVVFGKRICAVLLQAYGARAVWRGRRAAVIALRRFPHGHAGRGRLSQPLPRSRAQKKPGPRRGPAWHRMVGCNASYTRTCRSDRKRPSRRRRCGTSPPGGGPRRFPGTGREPSRFP